MGFRFRKSFGKGPFRVTISKSGISTSVGVKGIRFGSYASAKKKSSKNKSNKKSHTQNRKAQNSIENKKSGYKLLARCCRFLWIPMILLGLLVTLIKPIIGIGSIIIGIIEFIYSYKYFKKYKTTQN